MEIDIAKWVREARDNSGLTQEALSLQLGKSTKASVSAYEKGKTLPPFDVILDIAKICAYPLPYPQQYTAIGAQFGDNATISGENNFSVSQTITTSRTADAQMPDQSMFPIIPENSDIWLSPQTDIINGKIYALEYDGEVMYRQVFKQPEKRIRIKAYNAEFDEYIADAEKVRIIGRVSEWHVKNQ